MLNKKTPYFDRLRSFPSNLGNAFIMPVSILFFLIILNFLHKGKCYFRISKYFDI
jgi:hypothetical protein